MTMYASDAIVCQVLICAVTSRTFTHIYTFLNSSRPFEALLAHANLADENTA
jgi:hypothetical protein